jgi:hypothetical protein
MYNLLLNILLFFKFLGLKNILYFAVILLAILFMLGTAVQGFFVPSMRGGSFFFLLTGIVAAGYAYQWVLTKHRELLLTLLIDEATETIVGLSTQLEDALIQSEALKKLLTNLDKHVLRKAGVHLAIKDEAKTRLPN